MLDFDLCEANRCLSFAVSLFVTGIGIVFRGVQNQRDTVVLVNVTRRPLLQVQNLSFVFWSLAIEAALLFGTMAPSYSGYRLT